MIIRVLEKIENYSRLIRLHSLILKCFSFLFQKRKIDSVYFYMRSLMSSNPFQSARESLIALFDETRKKVSTILLTFTNCQNVLLLLKIHKKMIKYVKKYE